MTHRTPLTSRDPERIGEHRLLGRLGEGGQGIVYLAEAPSGRRVALKVLHDRGGSRDGFRRETSAARKVAPFCTAEILQIAEDDGLPYVVSEFIDGPSLRELVTDAGPQRGPALYRLAIGTATALAAIHQAGVVHRDFKPGNVLVGPDGPRVIDFGIARSMDATLTATSGVVGTPSYMAPEQLAGEPVGPPADVFAWGATIAYAANGRPPYGQDTVPAVMNRIVKGKPDLGDLTGPLRDLVTESLRKDPSRRPGSRDLLLRLLEHSHGPIAAPEALAQGRALAMADDRTLTDRTARWSTAPPPRRPHIGRRTLLAGTAAATALVVLGTALTIRQHTSAHHSPSPAATPLAAAPVPTARTTSVAPPTAPKDVAAAVEQAVTQRSTARFTANGQAAQGEDAFAAHGRLQYRPGAKTDYDLTVRNPTGPPNVTADERVILFKNCAYLSRPAKNCLPTDVDPTRMGDYVYLASQVRWMSSPEDILELLKNSTSLVQEITAGTVTYHGTCSLTPLSARGPVAPFYRGFGNTTATFALATTRDHLPKRLDLTLSTSPETGTVLSSPFSATYSDWGESGTVTRPS